VGLPDQLVPLARLFADGQQADEGLGLAQAGDPGTGIMVAMAGRATPEIRPMRSRALAMTAPVLPALTMAAALPSRTASAARTIDASFLRRTPCKGSSPMSMTSVAGQTSRPPASGMASAWPMSTTGTPRRSAASRAPATISPGPLSPPMTSTAMGSMSVT